MLVMSEWKPQGRGLRGSGDGEGGEVVDQKQAVLALEVAEGHLGAAVLQRKLVHGDTSQGKIQGGEK